MCDQEGGNINQLCEGRRGGDVKIDCVCGVCVCGVGETYINCVGGGGKHKYIV